MSVGILPGMASYAGGYPAVDSGNAQALAGAAVTAPGGTNAGARLAINLGANGTVAGTILIFALLYFGVMIAWHQMERLG